MGTNTKPAAHTPGNCMQCGAKVGPLHTKDGRLPTRGFDISNADPDGLFCTMRCAMRYGIAAARAAIAKATGGAQ